jgi:uncharacterized RmlC-like cupin family protein
VTERAKSILNVALAARHSMSRFIEVEARTVEPGQEQASRLKAVGLNLSGSEIYACRRREDGGAHSRRAAFEVTNMVDEYSPVRIVSPAAFDPGTAQTPGSVRLAAVAPQLGIQSALWGGLFEVKPGASTGIHHHGEQQTIAYVLSGICDVRWGARGEYAARAQAGDFIHVPAFLPHMEINPSDTEPFHWVVVRSTATPIVVNLPVDTWS